MNYSTQNTNLHDLRWYGEKVTYDLLQIKVLLDKNMTSYKQMLSWMRDISVLGKAIGESTVANLYINENVYRFNKLFPTMVDSLELSIVETEIPPVTYGITFAYDTFDIL
jgi:hypothetical protein